MYILAGVTPQQGHFYQSSVSSSFWGKALQKLRSIQQKATAGHKPHSLIILTRKTQKGSIIRHF